MRACLENLPKARIELLQMKYAHNISSPTNISSPKKPTLITAESKAGDIDVGPGEGTPKLFPTQHIRKQAPKLRVAWMSGGYGC